MAIAMRMTGFRRLGLELPGVSRFDRHATVVRLSGLRLLPSHGTASVADLSGDLGEVRAQHEMLSHQP
jgi:hypothetical protein